MKKITSVSGSVIRFRVNGSTMLVIDSSGVDVNDDHAAIVEERLGGQVSVVESEGVAVDSDLPPEDPTLTPPTPPVPAVEAPPADVQATVVPPAEVPPEVPTPPVEVTTPPAAAATVAPPAEPAVETPPADTTVAPPADTTTPPADTPPNA